MKKEEALKRERNKQRRAFYGRFRLRIIADHFRKKIYGQFQNSCFLCGYTEEIDLAKRNPWNMVIDHHVPLVQGGQYELGNLVVLCRDCNGQKKERLPTEFYSEDKLALLEILLAKQKGLFSLEFDFDWEFWQRNRGGYLLSLGIEPNLVKEALSNENHRYYVEPQSHAGLVIKFN